ncbi:MAG: ribonuclease H-like domain-containing protein [Verrucomicrobiota bacterium]|jgi:hypothetical protein|nr:ribonuclease H-like domain-containing protein [Verrucomicrobiota bacterium]
MKNIVYFDLETQRSAEEVGGWGYADRMGMSIGVTYSTARGSYQIYDEAHVMDLIHELQRADLVVGYNHCGFDYKVLMGYYPMDLCAIIPSLDMLEEVQKFISHRLKMDSLAQITLGVEKTAEGLQALRWFKEGKLLEIAEYCCFDVKITRLLYEYGLKHGRLYYLNRNGKIMAVPASWATGNA